MFADVYGARDGLRDLRRANNNVLIIVEDASYVVRIEIDESKGASRRACRLARLDSAESNLPVDVSYNLPVPLSSLF